MRLSVRTLVIVAAVAAVAVVVGVMILRSRTGANPSGTASTTAGDARSDENAPAVPTSEEVIAEALKAGTITEEESLIQRAYAWLNDPRLRKEFRSPIVDWEAGGWLLDEIQRKEAMLSQQTLAVLAPFRARPSDPKSVFNQPRTEVVKTRYAPGDPWTSIMVPGDPNRTPLRIWIKGQQPDLLPYLADAKLMWASYPKFFIDGMEDAGTPDKDFNPDNAVDMYLLHVGEIDPRCESSAKCQSPSNSVGGWTSIAQPDKGDRCASYVIINIDQRRDEIIGAMAHEMAHTGQRVFDCAEPAQFLKEGSATWVGYKVLRDLNIVPDYGYDYLNNPRRYSFFPNLHRSLDHPRNAYASWPFYFYASMQFGDDVVKRIWQSHNVSDGITGVRSVNKVVPLEEHFPQFAIRNWNQDGIPVKYQTDDHTFPTKWKPIRMTTMPKDPTTTELGKPLQSLSAWYYHYKEFDASVRRITFENLALDVPNERVWALKKVAGTWKTPEDWSKDEMRVLCRDMPAENVDELLLIVSNVDLEQDLPVAHPKPRVITEEVGCETVEGTASATLRLNDPDKKIDVTYVASITPLQFRPRNVQNQAGDVTYDLLPTSVVWSVSGKEADCTVSGQAVVHIPAFIDQPLDPTRPAYGFLNIVTKDGGDFHSIKVSAFDPNARETHTCPGNPPTVTQSAFRAVWLLQILTQANTHKGKAVSYVGQQTFDPDRFQDSLPPAALEALKNIPQAAAALKQRGGKLVYTFDWELRPRQSGP